MYAQREELAGKTIVPGGGIPARLELFQSTRGCTTGTFRIATSDATLAIPITSRLRGGVALSYFGGAGDGRVVSSPPGIDCHGGVGMCTWVFSDERVELTATPDVENHFTGWLGGCGSDPTCVGASLPSPSGHDLVVTHAAPYFASAEAKDQLAAAVSSSAARSGGSTSSRPRTAWASTHRRRPRASSARRSTMLAAITATTAPPPAPAEHGPGAGSGAAPPDAAQPLH